MQTRIITSRSLVTAAALVLSVAAGCSGDDGNNAKREQAATATLQASPETRERFGVVRWETQEREGGHLVEGLAADQTVMASALVETEGAQSNAIHFVSLPDRGKAVLDWAGEVRAADTVALGELAAAFFRDAQSPLQASSADPGSGEDLPELGSTQSALLSNNAFDTGWQAYNFPTDNCQARTTGSVYNRQNAAFVATTEIHSPYAFNGCRVTAELKILTTDGSWVDAGSITAMACGGWDPTCGSWQSSGQRFFNVPDVSVADVLVHQHGSAI